MKVLKTVGYWFWSLTWGALLSIPGLLVSLFLIIFMHKKIRVHKNGYSFIIEVGNNWGGFNLGVVSLCGGYTTTCRDDYWFELTRRHEFGHSLQNLIFGPFMLFVVTLPSAIRYHYQNYRYKKGLPNKEYEAIWFERTATEWGTKVVNKIDLLNTTLYL